jgi:hypothetical protein
VSLRMFLRTKQAVFIENTPPATLPGSMHTSTLAIFSSVKSDYAVRLHLRSLPLLLGGGGLGRVGLPHQDLQEKKNGQHVLQGMEG